MILAKHLEQYESLKEFSTISDFNDSVWVLDKLHKGSGTTSNKSRISFGQVPEAYIQEVKLFVYSKLLDSQAVTTVKKTLQGITNFLKWLDEADLSINKTAIMDYEVHLASSTLSQGTKEARWEALQNYLGRDMIGTINPFKRNPVYRIKHSKYISRDTLAKIDTLFKREELPHYIRTIYWILRLIPSRIGEITSLKIDCLEEQRDIYILKLNMFKQNGGYTQPQIRKIYLLRDKTSDFLISLIKKQQRISEELQVYLAEGQRGYLFTYLHTYYIDNNYIEQKPCPRFVSVINEDIFAAFLKKMPARYGAEYKFTSHQLRHNAIADRLAFGFTPQQIQELTAHKTSKMIVDSYAHYTEDSVITKLQKINNIEQRFNGRLINATMQQLLLKRPNSKVIKGLGICSNKENCQGEELTYEKGTTT